MTADQLDDLVNRQSGLLGISETSPDMRDLLARQSSDVRAAEAVAIFCYQAKKWIGAYVAALGGLDTLVFSGGIGENAAEVRRRICDGLDCFGIRLDAARNDANAAVISTEGSRAIGPNDPHRRRIRNRRRHATNQLNVSEPHASREFRRSSVIDEDPTHANLPLSRKTRSAGYAHRRRRAGA